jgi:uncharacterized Zn finger protein
MTADRVRGFPAFPPQHGRSSRGKSWWGNAWIKAMEDMSLDSRRLSRGRSYARGGQVGSMTVSPGRLEARVQGSDFEPYRTRVTVEQLTDAEWDRFLTQVAARAGHIAALLDRDMPHDLVAAAADAGIRLLPTVGDLDPECSCEDWGFPCKHAAALCYQASWLLDSDPFLLLLLRGRGERELLDELQRRNASAPAFETPFGTPAMEAFARPVPTLPALTASGGVASLTVPAAPGIDPDALRWLAADAAARAAELLAGAAPAALTRWQDTVRIAATYPDDQLLDRLQRASGRPAAELARAAQAWQCGGLAGLDALEHPWTPARSDLARARTAVEAASFDAGDDAAPDEWRNRWTWADRGVQLRWGRDEHWYPYRERAGEWWPAGPPEQDPATALADLLGT